MKDALQAGQADENADLTLRLHSTTDARVWAQEWIKTARLVGVRNQTFAALLDEGWMIGWFANAIEVGRDAGRREVQAQVAALLPDDGLG